MCVVLAQAAGGTSMSGGQGPRFSFTLVQPVSWKRDPCNRLRTRSAPGPTGSISTQRCRTTITCSEVCVCVSAGRASAIPCMLSELRLEGVRVRAAGGGCHTWVSWLEWLLSDSDRVKSFSRCQAEASEGCEASWLFCSSVFQWRSSK